MARPKKVTPDITYPNIQMSELAENWENDQFLNSCANVHLEGTTLVAVVNFVTEVRIPRDPRRDASPLTEELAALVIERMLVDIQMEIRPVLIERFKRALA